jgi:hypothetical protein
MLAGLDYERIEYSLERLPCFRIWVVENDARIAEAHRHLIKVVHEELTKRLEKRFQHGGLNFYQVNFRDPTEALLKIYALILMEQRDGTDVFVNISTGTKPMAIAATVAAALAGCSVVYFGAKEYSRPSGRAEVVATGFEPEPSPISIPIFGLLKDAMTVKPERLQILEDLLKLGQVNNITTLVKARQKTARGKMLKGEVARYYYYLKEMEKIGLVVLDDVIKPSDRGKLIVELSRIKRAIMQSGTTIGSRKKANPHSATLVSG